MAILIFDLGSFGWYCEWRNGPLKRLIDPNRPWQEFAKEVNNANGRALFLDGIWSSLGTARPNANLLYGLPSVGAYGPLILNHYANVIGVDPGSGEVTSLDNLRLRLQLSGAPWLIAGYHLHRSFHLGGDCSSHSGIAELAASLREPVRATHVEIVSHMQCSVSVPQDAPVLTMRVANKNGESEQVSLRAGQDTAEWAIEREDVAAVISHRRPPNSEAVPAGEFVGRSYHARKQLREDGAPIEVSSLNLHWLLPPGPGISVSSIEFLDARTMERHRVAAEDFVWGGELQQADERQLPDARWVRRAEGVRGPAWLVGAVEALSDEQSLATIHSGRLPDGAPFNPYLVAMIEQGAGERVSDTSGASAGNVTIEEWGNGLLRMEVDAVRSCVLVVAESYYPGWEARMDGQEVPDRPDQRRISRHFRTGRRAARLYFVSPISHSEELRIRPRHESWSCNTVRIPRVRVSRATTKFAEGPATAIDASVPPRAIIVVKLTPT